MTHHDVTPVVGSDQRSGSDPMDMLDEAMRSRAGLADPYPLLRQLVAKHHGIHDRDGNTYVLSHEAATETLRSPALYKGEEHVSSSSPAFTLEQVETLRRESPPVSGMLTSIDDPAHARLRRLVSSTFTPRNVKRLRDHTVVVVDRILAEIDRHEPVDLLDTLFTELPSEVMGELIGLPLSERQAFSALAAVSSIGRDPASSFDEHLSAVRARREMHALVEELLAQERRDPGETLIGDLVRAEAEGGRISDDELLSLTTMMHSAGFGTTRRALGNGLVALLRHPEQAAALRADPGLGRQAADEILRYDGSVMTVAYRVSDRADAAGIALMPGTVCTVVLGAANHDPRVFEDAERFDLTCHRRTSPLSFGHGAHYCLGAALARMEIEVSLGELVRRFPRMDLADEPVRALVFRTRTFTSVDVVLEPGRAR